MRRISLVICHNSFYHRFSRTCTAMCRPRNRAYDYARAHVSSRENTFPRRDLEWQITVAIVANPLIPHAPNELLPLVVAGKIPATKTGTRQASAFLSPRGDSRKLANDLPFPRADRADRTCNEHPSFQRIRKKETLTVSEPEASPESRRWC